MNNVIIPKTYVKDLDKPLIFLAGPIRGAPLWQDEAIKYLLSKNSNIIIASPRREARDSFVDSIIKGDETFFERQRAWERHYLDIASKSGVILFWLPQETQHDCKKSYGAMTRLELGQWITRYNLDNSIRFCIGSDGKFSELNTIAYDLKLDAPYKEIFSTLKETCDEALRLIE